MQKAQGSFAALRHDGTVVSWGIPRSGGDSSEVQDQYLVLQQQLGPTVSLPVFTFPETNSSPLKIVWDPKGNVIFKSLIFMGEFLVSGRVPRKSEQFQKDSKDCFVFCLHSSCMFRCCMIAVGNIGPEWMFFLEIRQDQLMLKMNYIYIYIYHSALIFASTMVFFTEGNTHWLMLSCPMALPVPFRPVFSQQSSQFPRGLMEFHHGNFHVLSDINLGPPPTL